MNQHLRRKSSVKASQRQTPSLESKRLELNKDMLPSQEWQASQYNDGFYATSPDDAVNRGKRADAKMMENLKRKCWHCAKEYNPPLFSNDGKLFCSQACSNAHSFTPQEQANLQENHQKEWQDMVALGVFDNRSDKPMVSRVW